MKSLKYSSIIIYTPSNIYKYTFQFHEAFIYEFLNLKINAVSLKNMEELIQIINKDILVIFLGNPKHEDLLKILKLPNNTDIIIYETECIYNNSIHLSSYYKCKKVISVWTYSMHNYDVLQQNNIPSYYFPFGYSKYYDYRQNIKTIKNNVITVLCDRLDDRLNRIKHINTENKKAWNNKEWQKEIADNHIVINLHKYENSKDFHSPRFVPLLSNGIRIISEHCPQKDEELFKDFIDFCNINEMQYYIDKYKTENKKNIIRNDIVDKFRIRFNMRQYIINFFKL
tara:strand:+ start:70 stop:921 length:852 start_codon:yes stop_codon:yes gene_type:complete